MNFVGSCHAMAQALLLTFPPLLSPLDQAAHYLILHFELLGIKGQLYLLAASFFSGLSMSFKLLQGKNTQRPANGR